MPRVLVVEDDTSVRSVVRAAVVSDGGEVIEATTAAAGLALARSERPELVILDLGLPDKDGRELCRELRRWSTVPILVLSARDSDREKAALLDTGADDYLTKPFSTIELQARIRARFRRSRMAPGTEMDTRVGEDGLAIDLAARSITRDGAPVHLTPTEWALLRALMEHAGSTMTHQQLFDAVWDRDHGDARQYLRVYVANLRRKLETDALRPSLIHTEPGVGYRFELPG